ncbi:pancreatic triacylglycerol lipase-like [Anneissia japonica]|uniref:pancreatic triacylglycerol lipase-like n=1 Tax=Anneissia japonica TaxID=1529436 RepID=UPI001425B992|nr:pancreatic triacylglycerol lipase-like [Anneissia japonica]
MLKNIAGISFSSVHLIGHSLGAHIAGYAGERLNGLGRITGLDSAGPYFEYTEPIVRLDPTDAVFVDAIHTDTNSIFRLGFGIQKAVGHLDFYPNDGHDQPGCDGSTSRNISDQGLIEYGIDQISCNHMKVLDYFTESTDDHRQFRAFSCQDYESYIDGACFVCGANGCPRMGLHADEYTPSNQRVVAFLRTVAEKPYAATDVTVEVSMANKPDGGQYKEKGSLQITWLGSNVITPVKSLSQTEKFESGQTYTYSTVIPENLGDIEGIKLWYSDSTWKPWGKPRIYIDVVNVVDHSVGKRVILCGSGVEIKPGKAVTLLPSPSC